MFNISDPHRIAFLACDSNTHRPRYPTVGLIVLVSSTIIEDVDSMQKAGLASLAIFYCDFREDQKKDLRGLLSSILVQLCHQSDTYYDILFEFYSKHA